jgi:mRNA interferase MazF
MPGDVRRGTLYAARLGPVVGSEQAGTRPVLIVSNDLFNAVMPIVTVVPLTSLPAGRRVYPSEVRVPKGGSGLRADSLALCHQARTIARSRLGRRIGAIEGEVLAAVGRALRVHLDL